MQCHDTRRLLYFWGGALMPSAGISARRIQPLVCCCLKRSRGGRARELSINRPIVEQLWCSAASNFPNASPHCRSSNPPPSPNRRGSSPPPPPLLLCFACVPLTQPDLLLGVHPLPLYKIRVPIWALQITHILILTWRRSGCLMAIMLVNWSLETERSSVSAPIF